MKNKVLLAVILSLLAGTVEAGPIRSGAKAVGKGAAVAGKTVAKGAAKVVKAIAKLW